MKKITIYKDLDLMSMEEINGYIDGFEEFKQFVPSLSLIYKF